MDVYGLTGGIGSGKSAVAGLLERYGIPVVSADELARIVVAPGAQGLRDVVEAFGSEVLGDGGELDRQKMASIVFADPEKRRALESILHPRIRESYEQVLEALAKAGHPVVIYEVPLLFEKDLQGDMKGVILVTAPEDIRIARVCARDKTSPQQVRARMATQMDEETKRQRADYVIENDGDLDDLRREVEFLLARYLRVERGRRPPHDRAAVPRADANPSAAPLRGPSSPPPPPDQTAAKRTVPPPLPAAEQPQRAGPLGNVLPPSSSGTSAPHESSGSSSRPPPPPPTPTRVPPPPATDVPRTEPRSSPGTEE